MLLLITSAKVRSIGTYMCEIYSILLKFCPKVLTNLLKNVCNSSLNLLKFPQFSAHEKSGNPVNLIFNHNPNLNITKKEHKKLFLFATSQNHFIFNSKFYNQISGVAMGSPLAPILANIFMGFYKSKWVNEYNLNKPKFYLRYVDDILTAFENKQDSLNFFNFLNNRHPNIKFTIEKQINHFHRFF